MRLFNLACMAAVAVAAATGRAFGQNITVCNALSANSKWQVGVGSKSLAANDCVDFAPGDPSVFQGCTDDMDACQTLVSVSYQTGNVNIGVGGASIYANPKTGDTVMVPFPATPAVGCTSQKGRTLTVTPAVDSLCPSSANTAPRLTK